MTTNTMNPFGQYSLQDMLTTLRNTMAYGVPGGLSDDALGSYLNIEGQRNIAALNAASQLAQANQTNQLRMMELFGTDPTGRSTDAANRWRAELTAQQQVQDERLRQEMIQTLGYDPTSPGTTTLESRTADQQAQAAREQNAIRMTELMGYERNAAGQTGGQTLAAQAQAAEIARQQAALYGVGPNGQPTLDLQRLQNDAAQAEAERQLRERLQSGQLSQQESEYARTYLLQQDENRRQNVQQGAELSGYQANGALTEAARAARAGETAQRAATAAQLLGTPKDIFRAGAYFQNLGGGATGATGLGLEGNTGVQGFTGFGSRLALPQTMNMNDMDQMLGAPAGGYTGTNGPPPVRALDVGGTARNAYGAVTNTGFVGPYQGGGMTATDPASAMTPKAPATPRAQTEKDILADTDSSGGFGTSPGGPVGMGAGGNFQNRQAPGQRDVNAPIPFMDPSVLEDPRVKRWLTDMRTMAQQDASIQENKGREKVQKKSTPANTPGYSEDGFLEREKRALRGVTRTKQKAMRAAPGTQPGGPVDAPLWPEDGGSSIQGFPELQASGSLGGGSGMTAAAPASTSQSSGGFNIPAQNDQRLQAVAELLVNRGPQGLGPQTLERMSSTQKGVTEGALDALGLNWDDFEDAYAQTRFANVGNALSA